MDTTTESRPVDLGRPAPRPLPTSLDEWDALWRVQALEQLLANACFHAHGKWAALDLVKGIAQRETAPWRQYDHKFDGARLYVVTVRRDFKGGAIEAGDVVIGEVHRAFHGPELRCWSIRKSSLCVVSCGWSEQ